MKKHHIKIVNKGEIPINSFVLMGATTKRDDSTKIGHFGSGLKYAIAVLMREKIPFRVFSGEKEVKFTTRPEKLGDLEFDLIKVNNKRTSLTTSMGPDWEPWFAIREIYSNALDAGEAGLSLGTKGEGEKGSTTFLIESTEKMTELMENWTKYFADKRTGDIYKNVPEGKRAFTSVFEAEAESLLVYRKGIRAHYNTNDDMPSLYHYNMDNIEINESRVVKSDWGLKYTLSTSWGRGASMEMVGTLIRTMQEPSKKYFEHRLPWEYATTFNINWERVIGNKVLVPTESAGAYINGLNKEKIEFLVIPDALMVAIDKYFPSIKTIHNYKREDGSDISIRELTKEEDALLQVVREFFAKSYPKTHKVPVKIKYFRNGKILGEAKDKMVFLAEELFRRGPDVLASTFLEEMIHIKTGFRDCERPMQTYLFEELMHYMKESRENQIKNQIKEPS